MRKPGARGQALLAEYEERRLAQQRRRSIEQFGLCGADDEPVIACSRFGCEQAARVWLRRADGREALRCVPHSLAAVGTDRREINPLDWRSLPDDPFEEMSR